MADLLSYKRNVGIETPSVVQFDKSGGQGLRHAAASIDVGTTQLLNEQKQGAEADALEAGKKAGLAIGPNGEINFNLLPNDSATNRKFNAGALHSYEASIGNIASKRALEIAAEHQMDPEGFQRKFQAETEARLASVPEAFQNSFKLTWANYGTGQYRAVLANKIQNDRRLQAQEFNAQDERIFNEGFESYAKGGTFDANGRSTGMGEAQRSRLEQSLDAQIKSGFLTPSGKELKLQAFDAKMRVGYWTHVFDETAGKALERGNIGGGLAAVGKTIAAIQKDGSIPTEEKQALVTRQLALYNQRAGILQTQRAEGDRAASQSFMRGQAQVISDAMALPEGERADYLAKNIGALNTRGVANLELSRAQLVAGYQRQSEVQAANAEKAANQESARFDAGGMALAMRNFADQSQRAARGEQVLNEDGTPWDPSVAAAVMKQAFLGRVQSAPDDMKAHYMQAWLNNIVQVDNTLGAMAQASASQIKSLIDESFGSAKGTAKNVSPDLAGRVTSNLLNALPEDRQQLLSRLDQLSGGQATRMLQSSKVYADAIEAADTMQETVARVNDPSRRSVSQAGADNYVKVTGKEGDPRTVVEALALYRAVPQGTNKLLDDYSRGTSQDLQKGVELYGAIKAFDEAAAIQATSGYARNFYETYIRRAQTAPTDVDRVEMAQKIHEALTKGAQNAPKVLQENRDAINREISKLTESRSWLPDLNPFGALMTSDAQIKMRAGSIEGLNNTAPGVALVPSFRRDLEESAAELMALDPRVTPKDAVAQASTRLLQAQQSGRNVYGLTNFAGDKRAVVMHPIEGAVDVATGGAAALKNAAVSMAIITLTGQRPDEVMKTPQLTESGETLTRKELKYVFEQTGDPVTGYAYVPKSPSILFNRERGGYEIWMPNESGLREPIRGQDGRVALYSPDDFKMALRDPKTGFHYQAYLDALRSKDKLRDAMGLGKTPQPLLDSIDQMVTNVIKTWNAYGAGGTSEAWYK